MANLTTLLYPVSVFSTNLPTVLTTSSTNVLSSRFTATGTVFNIQGISLNSATTYLQIRINNASYTSSTLIFSRIINPNENFDINLPYGIQGSPFHIVLSNSPTTINLPDDLYFFTVSYKG